MSIFYKKPRVPKFQGGGFTNSIDQYNTAPVNPNAGLGPVRVGSEHPGLGPVRVGAESGGYGTPTTVTSGPLPPHQGLGPVRVGGRTTGYGYGTPTTVTSGPAPPNPNEGLGPVAIPYDGVTRNDGGYNANIANQPWQQGNPAAVEPGHVRAARMGKEAEEMRAGMTPIESPQDRAARMGAEQEEFAVEMEAARAEAAKRAKTIRFQELNGLTPDGIWGENTQKAFDDVTARQKAINAANPDGEQLVVDGWKGAKTKAAGMAYDEANAAKSTELQKAGDMKREFEQGDKDFAASREDKPDNTSELRKSLRSRNRSVRQSNRQATRETNRNTASASDRQENRQATRGANKANRKATRSVNKASRQAERSEKKAPKPTDEAK
jgi:hypothetical protein